MGTENWELHRVGASGVNLRQDLFEFPVHFLLSANSVFKRSLPYDLFEMLHELFGV